MFDTPLKGAIELATKHDAVVFPLSINSKVPIAGTSWKTLGSSDVAEIHKLAKKYPGCNWGVDTERSGFTVIDLDKHGASNGVAAFSKLAKENNYKPSTLSVQTPTGGYHLIYKGAHKQGANVIAPGIDIRSRGGYIVALGSVVKNRRYTLKKDVTPIEVPEWLHRKLETIKETIKEQPKSEEMIGEGDRNARLLSIAGSLRSQGCGFREIEILLNEVNENRVYPPLPPKEIYNIANSVSKYPVEDAKAVANQLAELGLDEPEDSNFLFTPDDIHEDENLKIPWLAEGRYARRYLTVGIAKGGVGKTLFLFADLLSVALGRDLLKFGTKIEKANTWLHSTEDDGVDLKRRAIGVMRAHGVTKGETKGKFFMSSGRRKNLKLATLENNKPVRNLPAIELVKENIKKNKIGLFALDPFSGCHSLSENDNTHMVLVKDILNDIAEECNCAIVVLHHARKKNTKNPTTEVEDARGASALTDGARTVLVFSEMTAEEGKELKVADYRSVVRVSFVKSNNAPPAMCKPIWFKKLTLHDEKIGAVGAATSFDVLCNNLVEEYCNEDGEDDNEGGGDSGSSRSNADTISLSDIGLSENDTKNEVNVSYKIRENPPNPVTPAITQKQFLDAIEDTCRGVNSSFKPLLLARRICKGLEGVNVDTIKRRLYRQTENSKVIEGETVKIKRGKDNTILIVFS